MCTGWRAGPPFCPESNLHSGILSLSLLSRNSRHHYGKPKVRTIRALVSLSLYGMQGKLSSFWKMFSYVIKSHSIPFPVTSFINPTGIVPAKGLFISPSFCSQEASLYEELHPLESLCVIYTESGGNNDTHYRFNNKGFQIPQWWNGVEHFFKLNGMVTFKRQTVTAWYHFQLN